LKQPACDFGPRPACARPPGPLARQPTIGPSNRPGAARPPFPHGPHSGPRAAQAPLAIGFRSDGRPAISADQNRQAPVLTPKTLPIFPFLVTQLGSGAAAGDILPPRRPVRPPRHGRLLPSLLSLLSRSPPLSFLSNGGDGPSRARRGRRHRSRRRQLWPSRARRRAAVEPGTAEFLSSFLCFFSSHTKRRRPLGGGRDVGAGAGPLAGVRVHRSVGASPSRGSSSVLFRARAKPAAVLSRASSGSAGVFSLAAEQSTLVCRGGRRLWGQASSPICSAVNCSRVRVRSKPVLCSSICIENSSLFSL